MEIYLKLRREAVIALALVYMNILPLKAILVASEAVAASKWPRRPPLASDLNFVT